MLQVNKEIVKIQRVIAPVGQMQLKSLIEAHVVSTLGSSYLKIPLKEAPGVFLGNSLQNRS